MGSDINTKTTTTKCMLEAISAEYASVEFVSVG